MSIYRLTHWYVKRKTANKSILGSPFACNQTLNPISPRINDNLNLSLTNAESRKTRKTKRKISSYVSVFQSFEGTLDTHFQCISQWMPFFRGLLKMRISWYMVCMRVKIWGNDPNRMKSQSYCIQQHSFRFYSFQFAIELRLIGVKNSIRIQFFS